MITPPIVRLHRRATIQQHSIATLSKPCLIFPFSLNNGGYGQIRVNGKTCMAHIVAFEALVGPVPAGRELDHLCRIRPCIEVTHLEPVTHRENDLRGASPAIRRHLTGVCVRGHSLAIHGRAKSTGGQQCSECLRRARRDGYRALRDAGYSAKYAQQHCGSGMARRLAGWTDLRWAS